MNQHIKNGGWTSRVYYNMYNLAAGFKYLLFSPVLGIMIQFDNLTNISNGLTPPPSQAI